MSSSIKQITKLKFPTTNNESEYERLIVGLKLAQHLEVSVIDIFSDYQLVVKQVKGEFKALNQRMAAYIQVASKLLRSFTSWTINDINRSVIHWANALSKLATSNTSRHVEPIYVKEMSHPAIAEMEIYYITSQED